MSAAYEEKKASVPVAEVHIDGLALMKIVKHCNDNNANVVGSLLGLDVNGILEVTYSLPFPDKNSEGGDSEDTSDYQIEMMRMLRDVNVDNNCVGWYQSMSFGTVSTSEIVQYQFDYQSSEDLSENSVVILYDPMRSKKGNLVVKAFRLSDEYIHQRRNKLNTFIKPKNILQELPVKITNGCYASAFLRCMQDSHTAEMSSKFDSLSMASSEAALEKHFELINNWTEDLVLEQQRFQQYTRGISKPRSEQVKWLGNKIRENQEAIENGETPMHLSLETSGLKPLPEPPSRIEPLLMMGQVDRYCQQVNEHVEMNFQKLFATSQSHAT
jgi:translation initiation factor 3 subunit H